MRGSRASSRSRGGEKLKAAAKAKPGAKHKAKIKKRRAGGESKEEKERTWERRLGADTRHEAESRVGGASFDERAATWERRVKLKQGGMSIAEIARREGVSRQAMDEYFQARKARLLANARHEAKSNPSWQGKAATLERRLKLRKEGTSVVDIAMIEGVNTSGLYRYFRKHDERLAKAAAKDLDWSEDLAEGEKEEVELINEQDEAEDTDDNDKATNKGDENNGEDGEGDICFACKGERDSEAERHGEPVLLCDGHLCGREYHLGCLGLKAVPEGHFYCPRCETAGGAAAHLEAYLDSAEEESSAFSSSKEYVHHLLRTQMRRAIAAEDEASAGRAMDEMVATEGRAPRNRPARRSGEGGGRERGGIGMATDHWPERERPPRSELLDVRTFYAAAMRDVHTRSRTVPGPDGIVGSGVGAGAEVQASPSFDGGASSMNFGPSFLVGRPIQLYCPSDNEYHRGRIVGWRASARYRLSEFYGGRDGGKDHDSIASSEFMVRFPAGINGRRRSLRQWIVLEEHSVAVSIAIVFAQFNRGSRGLSSYRPAQLFVRSSLELIPVRRLLSRAGHGVDPQGLIFFFGEASQAYLRLGDEVGGFFSPAFDTHRGETRVEKDSAPLSKALSAGDQCQPVNLAGTLAFLEHDEQTRVNAWHRMPLHDSQHEKALTVLDEFTLGPIPIRAMSQKLDSGRADSKVLEDDCGKESGTASDHNTEDESRSLVNTCPQIEKGIDRQWLLRTARAQNIELEQSLDVVAGLTIKPVACKDMPWAMALLQRQRGGMEK